MLGASIICINSKIATIVAAFLLVPRPSPGDMETGRRTLLTPQIIVPLGELGDIAGAGAGIGLQWFRPLDAELTLVTSVDFLGFRRQTLRADLLSVESLIRGPMHWETSGVHEVLAMPVLAGIRYSGPSFFAGVSVGNLVTRVEKTTRLAIGTAEPQNVGTNSRIGHGPMVNFSFGLERGNTSFAGIRLGLALGERGVEGRSHFSWLTVFVSL